MRAISVQYEGMSRDFAERQAGNGVGGRLWRMIADAPDVAGKEEEDLWGQDAGGWQASALSQDHVFENKGRGLLQQQSTGSNTAANRREYHYGMLDLSHVHTLLTGNLPLTGRFRWLRGPYVREPLRP